jgi:hypothetical protein
MATGGQSLGVIYHQYEIRGLAEAEKRMADLEKRARNLGMGGGGAGGAGGGGAGGGSGSSSGVISRGGIGAGAPFVRATASDGRTYVTPRSQAAAFPAGAPARNLTGSGPLLGGRMQSAVPAGLLPHFPSSGPGSSFWQTRAALPIHSPTFIPQSMAVAQRLGQRTGGYFPSPSGSLPPYVGPRMAGPDPNRHIAGTFSARGLGQLQAGAAASGIPLQAALTGLGMGKGQAKAAEDALKAFQQQTRVTKQYNAAVGRMAQQVNMAGRGLPGPAQTSMARFVPSTVLGSVAGNGMPGGMLTPGANLTGAGPRLNSGGNGVPGNPIYNPIGRGGGGGGPGQGMGRRTGGRGGAGRGGGGILNHPGAFGVYFGLMFGGWEVGKALQATQEASTAASLTGDPLAKFQAMTQGVDAVTGGVYGASIGLGADVLGGLTGLYSPAKMRREGMVQAALTQAQIGIGGLLGNQSAYNRLQRAKGAGQIHMGLEAIDIATQQQVSALGAQMGLMPTGADITSDPSTWAKDIGWAIGRTLTGGPITLEGLARGRDGVGFGSRSSFDESTGRMMDRQRESMRRQMEHTARTGEQNKLDYVSQQIMDRQAMSDSIAGESKTMDILERNHFAQGTELISHSAGTMAQIREMRATGMAGQAFATMHLLDRRIQMAEDSYLNHGFGTVQMDREMALGMSMDTKESLFSAFDAARSIMNGTLRPEDMTGSAGSIGGRMMGEELEELKAIKDKLQEMLDALQPG